MISASRKDVSSGDQEKSYKKCRWKLEDLLAAAMELKETKSSEIEKVI